MYNKPLTFAATTLLLCSPVIMLTSCEGEKDSAAQTPALVPEVQVTKLVTKDVPIRQEWVGTLRGTEDAEIRSQVTGYLLSKDYRDGAYVKKGQVLFQIDPRPFQATLDQAQGRLEQYEATLKKYKLDVGRYTPLVKTGSVSRKQLDDALQQVQETEAAIATAKAQVDEAKINLKFTTITAPISGLAGLATPSIGNLLTPSSPTPLTTISGYAELIQSGMTEPKDIPVFARKIYNESRRLLKLIEDIMHLSKLDEGFAAGCLRRVDLLEAARTAVEENAEAAGDRNVTVRLTGDSVFINADPTLLDEMLRNVIENGVKYNRLNGEVQVEVSRLADSARVRVTDTGIGIPQEHQDKVFERFYRVDGSRSKQTGGTGLGLSIVKHGAEYHHAKVELNSEVGRGTEVTMTFPLATDEEHEA